MDDLLDTVIDNTQNRLSGPVIVSEVHDLGRIKVDEQAIQDALRGLAGGAAWDAAEYGITIEQAARMIQEADTPENREWVMADLRQRAIDRAGLDVSNGRVNLMVAGDPAWHGLGVQMSDAPDGETAYVRSGLNWPTLKQAMAYRGADGRWVEDDETFSLVRGDTFAKLATVGTDYKAMDNREMFEFMGAVLGQFDARYESAGSLYGGKKVFVLVRLPRQAFAVNSLDKVDAFALLVDTKGGASAKCFPTSNRVVCANTLRLATQNANREWLLKIRHTGNLKAKVAAARTALGVTIEEMDKFKETAQVLARKPLDERPYFEGLLDAVCEVTEAQRALGAERLADDFLATAVAVTQAQRDFETKRFERAIAKRDDLMEELQQRYDSDTCGVGGIRGSAWSALNAATEAADYGGLGSRQVGKDKKSRRFESVMMGEADRVKQIAYEQVLRRASAG